MLKLSKLPYVPLKQWEQLPEAAGVYLCLDNANRVWYIGSSNQDKAH